MKKTILYLINGLGVASKDSFDIKFNELMPNLSMLMGNYIYSNIENKSYNYKNAFRNFSLGGNLLPTYNRLDTDANISNNPTILNIATDAINNKTKLHLFCFLDNEKVVNQIVKIINVLQTKGSFPIYIHIVLRQKDYQSYDDIIKLIKSLEDKITLLKTVRIGTIVGERKINEDSYYQLLIKQKGEKWPDFNRKLNYSNQTQVSPRELDGFYMHEGFQLVTHDISLFMNYEDVDCNEFISKITNVKLYTLFPMKAYSYAINIYDDIPPPEFFSKSLEENNLKCLILTTEDRIPSINHNLCGLKDTKSLNIEYRDINSPDLDKLKVLDEDYQYIIFDYDIGIYNELGEIKDSLMAMDNEIEQIYKVCDQNSYNYFIASLYGIYKEYTIGVGRIVKLDYSSEVPVIIIDNDYPASKYTLKYGDTHDLSNTIFLSITNNININSLYRKKGILAFFKE